MALLSAMKALRAHLIGRRLEVFALRLAFLDVYSIHKIFDLSPHAMHRMKKKSVCVCRLRWDSAAATHDDEPSDRNHM